MTERTVTDGQSRNDLGTEWVCSDCGAPSKFVKTGFLDYVKPQCTVCGSGSATAVSKDRSSGDAEE